MKLKDKTNRKFLEFFEKMASMYQGKDFELAYSDIQRETGTASVTMKRAIQSLQENGTITVMPGRNSRYGKFRYLKDLPKSLTKELNSVNNMVNEKQEVKNNLSEASTDIDELYNLIENLRRRVRTQEMAIALLQDRLAEIEDKLFKR